MATEAAPKATEEVPRRFAFLETLPTRALSHLSEGVDSASLRAFRFLLGTLLVLAVLRHWLKNGIADGFVVPTHFFAYDGLEFIKPLPGQGMYGVYVAMAICGAGLAIGYRSRLFAAGACLLFTYAHLCDKTTYLNHYYLISILLGLAAFLPLGSKAKTFPRWMLWLVRFQIGVVYFYGGVAKLGTDWLFHAMPLKIWLAANGDFPVLGPILRLPETAYVMSWAGAAFDLSVAFLLTQKRTRPFAYGCVVVFHLVTARLFQIGMFPYVMIALTLVFFSPSWPRELAAKLRLRWRDDETPTPAMRGALHLAMAWCVFQAVFPLRSHLFTSDVIWTEDSYRFSWRVMLIEKAGSAEITAVDPVTHESRIVRLRDWLTPMQVKMMSTQPDMLREFAHMVADDAEKRGERRPIIHADVLVTLNGRPPMRLIDPSIDLASIGALAPTSSFVLPRDERMERVARR